METKYGHGIPRPSSYHKVEVPTVIQMEAVECGAACLCMILAYYKKYIPLDEARQECSVTRDGASVGGILLAAKHYGLLAEGHMVDLAELYKLPLPLIVFWEFRHFVVVEGFSKKEVHINDPAVGAYSISYEQFSRSFTGVVCLFKPASNFVKSGSPASTLKIITNLVRKAKIPFLYSFLTGLCLVIPGLAVPAFTQVFIDNILVNHIYSWEGWFFFIMGLTLALTLVLKALQLRVLSRLYIHLSTAFSAEFLHHILRLPYFFYVNRFSGEVANRMQLNDGIAKTVSNSVTGMVIDVIVATVFGLAMFYYDVYIALFGLFIVAADMYLMFSLYRSRENAYYYFQQTTGKSLSYSIGSLRAIESIKMSGLENVYFSRWAGYYTKTLNALQDMGKKDIYLSVLPDLLKTLTLVMILGFGAWRVMEGHLTIGMLMALVILMENFTRPITRLANFNQVLQLLKVDTDRINDVMNHPVDSGLKKAEASQVDLLKTNISSKLKGDLELKDVSYGYDKTSEPILKNISLKVSPGAYIGIVGTTGSGKSTLSKIITGLIEPWEGDILFDKQKREALPRSLLLNSLSVVEQEANLFYGTIKDNISFFNPLVPQEIIMKAAKDACIHDLIVSKRGGYELHLETNASNLSGGERQRIELARAFAKLPSILVLDEATSALDTEVEEQLMLNIRHRGCTCLIIAHRLSTTRYCDEIIVLDKGRIVQQGTPEELSITPGIYKEMIDLENHLQKSQL